MRRAGALVGAFRECGLQPDGLHAVGHEAAADDGERRHVGGGVTPPPPVPRAGTLAGTYNLTITGQQGSALQQKHLNEAGRPGGGKTASARVGHPKTFAS